MVAVGSPISIGFFSNSKLLFGLGKIRTRLSSTRWLTQPKSEMPVISIRTNPDLEPVNVMEFSDEIRLLSMFHSILAICEGNGMDDVFFNVIVFPKHTESADDSKLISGNGYTRTSAE